MKNMFKVISNGETVYQGDNVTLAQEKFQTALAIMRRGVVRLSQIIQGNENIINSAVK